MPFLRTGLQVCIDRFAFVKHLSRSVGHPGYRSNPCDYGRGTILSFLTVYQVKLKSSVSGGAIRGKLYRGGENSEFIKAFQEDLPDR